MPTLTVETPRRSALEPGQTENSAVVPPKPGNPGDDEQVSILIVDDVPGKLLAHKSLLEELGQRIVTANSGREALEQLLKRDFAVILLDVNMPEMDGFETAAMIRQRPKFEHTPIIFITA